MLNVLLVEDELIVRKGLVALIDWDQYDMKVAFEATNGEQALQILNENEIDVIITDIRMPIMNGIELTKNVKQFYPQIKVMLLTCYDDFEYVQEALQLGASCYLLKTDLEDGNLEKQLLKISNEIKSEKEKKITFQELEMKASQTSFYIQENQIRSLLKGGLNSELHTHLHWLYSNYYLIRMVVKDHSFSLDTYKENIKEVMTSPFMMLRFDSETIVAMISIPDGMSQMKKATWQKQLMNTLEHELNTYTEKFSFYYIESKGIEKTAEQYNEIIKKSNNHFFYYGFGHSINVEELSDEQKANFRSINVQQLSEFTILRDWPNVKLLCDEAFQFYAMNEIDEDTVKWSVVTIVETIISGLQSNSHLFTSSWGNNSLDYKERVKDQASFTALASWFYKGLSELEESRIIFIGGVHQVVKQSISYIEYNYSREITLEELSKDVGLSRSYLSTIFKKETGKSIVEYVNEVRIRNAKQLLIHSDLKVFEIAEKIGFKDPKYFSKQFKRFTGISPNDYKNNLHELA